VYDCPIAQINRKKCLWHFLRSSFFFLAIMGSFAQKSVHNNKIPTFSKKDKPLFVAFNGFPSIRQIGA